MKEKITEHKLPHDIVLHDVTIYKKDEIIMEERAFVHGNECDIQYLTCKVSKNLSKFILIRKDLEDCKKYLIHVQNYQEREIEAYSEEENLNKSMIANGLYKSFSISYGKCFASSDSRGPLKKKTVFKGQEKYLKNHDKVISLRNKYFAHAGNENAEKTDLRLITGKNKDKKIVKHIFIQTMTMTSTSGHSLEEEISLVNFVKTYIEMEINKVMGKLKKDYKV